MLAVVAVFGPTASGKTEVAEAVADRLGTGVVSCDALQVYRGLPILTNQPSRPTSLVAIRELGEEMSVGAYASVAHEAIDDLVGRYGAAVVSGGSARSARAARRYRPVPPLTTAACRRNARADPLGGRGRPGGSPRAAERARSCRRGRRAPERRATARARP